MPHQLYQPQPQRRPSTSQVPHAQVPTVNLTSSSSSSASFSDDKGAAAPAAAAYYPFGGPHAHGHGHADVNAHRAPQAAGPYGYGTAVPPPHGAPYGGGYAQPPYPTHPAATPAPSHQYGHPAQPHAQQQQHYSQYPPSHVSAPQHNAYPYAHTAAYHHPPQVQAQQPQAHPQGSQVQQAPSQASHSRSQDQAPYAHGHGVPPKPVQQHHQQADADKLPQLDDKNQVQPTGTIASAPVAIKTEDATNNNAATPKASSEAAVSKIKVEGRKITVGGKERSNIIAKNSAVTSLPYRPSSYGQQQPDKSEDDAPTKSTSNISTATSGAAATVSPNPNLLPSTGSEEGKGSKTKISTNGSSNKEHRRNISAVSAGSLRRELSSDSAEDIAVSALSMLCGVAAAAAAADVATSKPAQASSKSIMPSSADLSSSQPHPSAFRGSPSFEENRKRILRSGVEGEGEGGSRNQQDRPANISQVTSIDSTGVVRSEGGGNTVPVVSGGPCHVSPVSTVGSGDHGADGDGDPNNSIGGNRAGTAVQTTIPRNARVPYNNERSFPLVLHEVLSQSRHAGTVLDWLPHGQGWRVLRWDELARTVLPEYFPQFCSGPSGEGHITAFLDYVKALGFREVREAGPDMGSYRHGLFLRGNPNLSCQIRLSDTNQTFQAPSAFPSGSSDSNDVPVASLQVPSLPASSSTGSAGGNAVDKRKIGQTVSRDSTSSTGSPSSKRGRFHSVSSQSQMGIVQLGQSAQPFPLLAHQSNQPVAEMSKLHLASGMGSGSGTIFRGGRVSMRGRSREVIPAGTQVPKYAQVTRHPGAPANSILQQSGARIDRRDETEQGGAVPRMLARGTVSTRGRGGGGRPLRSPVCSDGKSESKEVHAMSAMLMMKGTVSAGVQEAAPTGNNEKEIGTTKD